MSTIPSKCRESQHICDKNQYKESNFLEKMKLMFHLIFCSICRKHVNRNSKLTKLMKNPSVVTLDANSKEKLNTDFKEELAKHHY